MSTESSLQTLSLSAWAYGGEALGWLPDKRAVFVPFALPGETVRVRLVEEKHGYARAELLEVVNPSPERVPARCVHFGECGGCHYQHLSYEAQLAGKQAILGDMLERIGKLKHLPLLPAIPSPQPYEYRNYIQFHLTPEGHLGFFRARSKEVLPIQECHLPEAPLADIWPLLDFESMPEIERVGLRAGEGEDVQLILESSTLQPPELCIEGVDLSVVHLSPGGTLILAGSETTFVRVLDRLFRVSAGSFFQINTRMAERMVVHLLDTIPKYFPLAQDTILVDAYCGVGLFSAFLAPRLGRLIGIESSPYAAEDFSANLDEFEHVELYEASVEMALPALKVKPDVILVDPPRAGISRGAMDGLLAISAPLLVYISCDPTTLARDARRLIQGGYQLMEIGLFDLFPQTYHIESISFWTK